MVGIVTLVGTLVGIVNEQSTNLDQPEVSIEYQNGCVQAGLPRLTLSETTDLINEYDWTPFDPNAIAHALDRESGRYVSAKNLCSGAIGLFQIHPVHFFWCDSVRAYIDAAYNTWCAYEIFKLQGITAWTGFKGVLYD